LDAPGFPDGLGVALVGFRDGFGVAFAVGPAVGRAVRLAVGSALVGAMTTTAAGSTDVEVQVVPPARTEKA